MYIKLYNNFTKIKHTYEKKGCKHERKNVKFKK